MTTPLPPGMRRIADPQAEMERLAEARKGSTARPDNTAATARCGEEKCDGGGEAVTYPQVLALIRECDEHSARTGHHVRIEVWTNGKPA